MKKGFRKVISLTCAVSMMLSCVPFRAISDGETGFEQEDIELTELMEALNPDEAEEVVIGEPAEEAGETTGAAAPEMPAEGQAAPAEPAQGTSPESIPEAPAGTAPETPSEAAAEAPAGTAQETPAETIPDIPAEDPDTPAQDEPGMQEEDAQPDSPEEDPDTADNTENEIRADREIDLSQDPERNDWNTNGTLADGKEFAARITAGRETDLFFLLTSNAETDAVLTDEEYRNPKAFTKEHNETDDGTGESTPLIRYTLKGIHFEQGSSRLVRINGSAGTVFSLRVLTPEGWQLLQEQEAAEDEPTGEDETEPGDGEDPDSADVENTEPSDSEDTEPAEIHGDEPQQEDPNPGDTPQEEIPTFETENDILVGYNGREETVTVPEGIREIGSRAFYGNEGIRRVILPDSVELINNSAFAECLNLEKVVLTAQSRLATIGHLAFRNDRKLDISFAENVPNVISSAFEGAGIPADEEETGGDPETGEENPVDPENPEEEPGGEAETGEDPENGGDETGEDPEYTGEETGEDPENPEEETGEDTENDDPEADGEENGEDGEADKEESGEDPENPEEETGEDEEAGEEETDEEESDEEPEEEILLQESPLVFEGEDYTVTVDFGEDAGFLQGTELQVREILPGTDKYLLYSSQTEEILNENWDEVAEFARYFDITFIYNEEEIEPQAPINVQVTFAEAIPVAEDNDLQAIHFAEEGAQVISSEAQSVEAAVCEEDAVDTVAFSSESFSVYGFVQTAKITEKVIAADGSSYNITVTYEQDSGIPVNADLAVSEILPEDGRYETLLQEALQAAGKESAAYARFFDIEIRSGEEKIEPEDRVSVRMSLDDVPEAETEEMQIVHFAEEKTILLETETGDDSSIRFATDSFSVYGVIAAPSNPTVDDLDGMTFKISQNNRYMTSAIWTSGNTSRFGSTTSADDATVWQFESAGAEGKYYIFTLDSNNQKKYIKLNSHGTSASDATLADAGDAFTVSKNGDSYVIATDKYYLRELSRSSGFTGDINASYDHNLTLTFTQPQISASSQYVLLTKVDGEYYVILNDGTLARANSPELITNEIGVNDPMVWTYDRDTLHHNGKEAGFTDSNLTSDFFYRYLDPDSATGYSDENYDNTTGHPGYGTLEYYVDSHLVDQNKMKVDYSGHHISSRMNPGNYLGIEYGPGGPRIVGQQSKENAAEIFFMKLNDMGTDEQRDHAVNHIDISVESKAAIRIPLAYGEYYYKDNNGTIQKLVVNRENPVTITVQQQVDIDRDDIKRANISTYTIDANGTQTPVDNAFYITGYSGNSENDTSTNQVRIEGNFKVANLGWVWNVDNNVKNQRLQNRIYYTVTTTKDIEVPFIYNDFPLYSSAEDAATGDKDKCVSGTAIVKLSSSFSYWDPENECPPVRNNADWRSGGIIGGSGMDFALGGTNEDQNSILAVEITKYLVDEAGNPIIPSENVNTLFHIYRSSSASPKDVIGMDVDEYAGGQAQYNYTGNQYHPAHDKTVTVGDNGIGIVYDYDVPAGMIYLTEDTSEENLPRKITDEKEQTWSYKSTYIETEYVWRDDGIEYRRHVSKEYTSTDEIYRSIPEILGEYRDINGIDRYNGFLEFYFYNVYTLDPIDVSVRKNWMHENGTVAEAPEHARITLTLGRYKLVEDPDHPISGDLIIQHNLTFKPGETSDSNHYNVSYTVKQGSRVVRSGTYSPTQTTGTASNTLIMKDLPAGTYTLELMEGINGYTAVTEMDGIQTTTKQITITAGEETNVTVATELTPIPKLRLVNLRVTNRMDYANNPYQDETLTFPAGRTVVFTIYRPSRAYQGSGFTASLNGSAFPWPEGDTNTWTYVDQKWEYTIPADSQGEILNFVHNWGQENFVIKSVVLKSETGNSKSLNSSKMSDTAGMTLRASAAKGETRETVVLTGNPPVSDLPGMMYVADDEWPSAEEGDINKVILGSGLWSDVVRDLPSADSEGHKYLYYIEAVEEQNVPEGTRVEILSDSKGYVLTSNGETLLQVTNTIPDEPPKITLQKTDENGVPLTGATFDFTKADGTTERITINSPDGIYQTEELVEGAYFISEFSAPRGYERYSGGIAFTVEGKNVVAAEALPDGVTYDPETLTFTVANQPVSNGKLRIMKRWLDIFGNEAEAPGTPVTLKIVQMVQNQVPTRIVRVEFYYKGNGNGGNNIPWNYDSLWTQVATRRAQDRGLATVEFRWNDWTDLSADKIRIEGSEFAHVDMLGDRKVRLSIPDDGNGITTVKVYVDNGNWNPWGNGGTRIDTGGYINDLVWPNKNDAGEGYTATGGTKTVSLTSGMQWISEIEFAGTGMLSNNSARLPATYQTRACRYIIMEEPALAGYSVSYSSNNLEGLGAGAEGTITAYNRENSTDITLIKVDKEDHQEKLQGAVFEIRKLNSNSAGVNYLETWGTQTVTTDDEGMATVSDLGPGYYEIREVTAPSGYVIPEGEEKDRFYIKVMADGITAIARDDGKYPARWATRRNDSTLVNNQRGSFTVGNEAGHMDINVLKVKTDDMTTPLTGAKFVLKQYDAEYTTLVKTWEEQTVSEEEGSKGTLTFEGLQTGYYELVETQCPVGYVPVSAGPIRFRVEANGNQSQMFFNYPTGDVIWDETTGTFKVGNKPGVKLPNTGGTGTAPYTAAGAALILLGSGMLARRKRRALKERGRC